MAQLLHRLLKLMGGPLFLLLIHHNLHLHHDVSRQQLELPPDSHHISVHQSRSVLHYFHHKEGGLFAWLDNWWLKVPSHAQHHDGSPWGPCYLSTWAHN